MDMSADSTDRAPDRDVERVAAPVTDARERLPDLEDDATRPLGRFRRRREPESFPTRPSTEFGLGAGRLETTFGRAMLAWPGRDPLRRSDRR
jgi:hypothetical protein